MTISCSTMTRSSVVLVGHVVDVLCANAIYPAMLQQFVSGMGVFELQLVFYMKTNFHPETTRNSLP